MIRHKLDSGVTLVELVIVIVVVGILIVPLASGFSTTVRSLSINNELQTSVTYAQECAEHILYMRRDPAQGFASIVTPLCTTLPTSGSLNRSVTVSNIVAGAGLCPATAAACKSVAITVTQGLMTRANVNMYFVNN